jgi:hypothetical protein
MQDIFSRHYPPGEIHRFWAQLDVPLLILTTTFDDLLERAFEEQGRPYHLVVQPTGYKEAAESVLWWKPGAVEPEIYPPARLQVPLSDATVIYKMHGSVDRRSNKWDSLVITEEDHIDFLGRMARQAVIPARFMLEFRKRRFLFIGYGLRDWDLRLLLSNLRMTLTGEAQEIVSAWAIQFKPSEIEQVLWRQRDVQIFDMTVDQFGMRLRQALAHEKY